MIIAGFVATTTRKFVALLISLKAMSKINPQYTYDDIGNPVGVFLPINEWSTLLNEARIDIPEWQKILLDNRLEEYQNNPDKTEDWEDILAEMEDEDEKV